MLRIVTIRENERALLYEGGRLVRVLNPGRHYFWNMFTGREIVKYYVVRSEVDEQTAAVVEKMRPEIAAKSFETVATGKGEVAIVSFDGLPTHLVGPWAKKSYWKVLTDVGVELIDTTDQLRVSDKHRDMINADRTELMTTAFVQQHEAGLLYVDGAFVEQLKPGRHAFWAVNRRVEVEKFDLRPSAHEITAQEILTKDRVSLRLTLTAFLKVTDPVKTVESTPDYETYIYRLVQFGIREAVANRTLDEVLNDRNSIDAQLRAYVDQHIGDIGVMVTELGVKDIILPGEMRVLINKVVEAEKSAQANLIRRREETAATRSLLNTARLMENNPLLLRLKEMEALEKLTEKVGNIELITGRDSSGFDGLLTHLLKLENGQSEKNGKSNNGN